MADDRYQEEEEEVRPAPRPDVPRPDEDYRLPPPGAGRTAVTVYGVATLVLAAVLLLSGGACGVGSAVCYAGADAALHPPPAAPNANGGPGAAASAANGCGNAIGGAILTFLAFMLAVAMLVHLALAGGQFTAGVGVLRRRPWARVLAIVLSAIDLCYGGLLLYNAVRALIESDHTADPSFGWVVLAAVVGLFLVAHAALGLFVMCHPACAAEFAAPRPVRRYDFYEE